METFERTIRLEIEHRQEESQAVRVDRLKGVWIVRDRQHLLRYHDPHLNATTFVKWEAGGRELWVIRQGDVQVRQHFLPGKSTFTRYVTLYGSLPLETHTQELTIEQAGQEGSIVARFRTRIGGSDPIEHRLQLGFQLELANSE